MEFKETLPKSGHVHEVCKEWLVREDGALAYRLQSQEINEYYQGNKYRNAVVRQDFPTALHEQIKEKETAEQEAARYYKLLKEQEEADKCLAEKLANKLEKDEQVNLHEIQENEVIAKQVEDTYVNLNPNDNVYRAIPTCVSDSYDLTKTEGAGAMFNNDHSESFISSDFSENLICDRFEKLHCRPKNPNYEPYLDVTHNIRNADIQTYQNISEFSNRPKNIIKTKEVNLNIDNNIEEEQDVWLPRQEHQHQISISSTSSSSSRKHSKPSFNKNTRNNNEIIPPMQLNIIDDINKLTDMGLSPEDFVELNKKLEQEKSDEELARYLQEEEQKRNLTQEEKDRLLAIEAQDKELAIMLQEREKSKAKRAREKARLKKIQAKEMSEQQNSNLPILNEPYSNPKDLIPESQPLHHKLLSQKTQYDFPQSEISDRNLIEIDKNHNLNCDEIYALPVDNNLTNHSEIDSRSNDEVLNSSVKSRTSLSPSSTSLISSYHQQASGIDSSLPKPPYMPIHDIGVNSPLEGKKKKSKDKCTHQ